MKRYWVLSCCLAMLEAVHAAAPTPIYDRHKTLRGMLIRNRYAYVALMNSASGGRFGARDFRILPRTRLDGRETLDPSECMFRYMIRPEVNVIVEGRRGPRSVASEKGWGVSALPDGGVAMKQVNGEDESLLTSELSFSLHKDLSVFEGVCKITSSMDRECTVSVKPALYALLPELKPMRLILPRRINLFTIAGKETYWRHEETLLNNDHGRYWWRAAGKNSPGGEAALYSETVTFDDAQVAAPNDFGVSGFAGDELVVWQWGEKDKPAALEFNWLRDVGRVTPVWIMKFAPGESREFRFRLLMVRGATRYDNIEKNWIFAYLPENSLLRVVSLPLCNEERVSLNVSLADARGTNMVNNRREMKGTSPMEPGRMNYSIRAPFVAGERYKLQLQIDSLKDGSRLLEVSGLVQP